MTKMTTHLKTIFSIVILFTAIGCSKSTSEVPSSEIAAEDDILAQQIIESGDVVEAREWVQNNPESQFGDDGAPLSSIVDRLFDAGAERVVVQTADDQWYAGLIVVLPADAEARKGVFALEPELSKLNNQREVEDHAQKHLYYSR